MPSEKEILKSCATCTYFSEGYGSTCTHPDLREWDPVLGYKNSWPQSNRVLGSKCGPEGKYWERYVTLWEKLLNLLWRLK